MFSLTKVGVLDKPSKVYRFVSPIRTDMSELRNAHSAHPEGGYPIQKLVIHYYILCIYSIAYIWGVPLWSGRSSAFGGIGEKEA